MPATLNGRYRLHEEIGSGAAGRVYRAYDEHLGRDVAIKRLHEDTLEDADARVRFQREAIALARISHPHVLPVFDVSTDATDPYLVLNYCPDGSLADLLRQGTMTAPDARELARQTSAGLAAMHAAGVIHRDVKPSNILRLANRWLISDLGIARVDDHTALTETGARIGTPQYWAPETARGEQCTAAVDVYGLGCVLYEALNGEKLFEGGSPIATGLLHATASAPPLPSHVERADPELATLVTRMLAKAPSMRPTAASIQRRLGSAGGVTEIPTQRIAPPTAAAATLRLPPVERRSGWSPSARERARLAAIAALLLVGIAGAFALIRSGDDPRTPAAADTRPAAAAATTEAKAVPVLAGRVVPDVGGEDVATATAQLADLDLRLAVLGAAPADVARGVIIGQVPAARSSIAPGSVVSVTLSAGPEVAKAKPAKQPKRDKPKKNHGVGRP